MRHRHYFAVAFLLLASTTFADDAAKSPPALTFEKHVRVIFKAHCFECHGGGREIKGGLDLRLRRFIAKGGESGAGFVAGKPDESLLLERVREGDMPPGDTKLTAAEIETIVRWIKSGAKTVRPEPEKLEAGDFITEEERNFWSFLPIRRPDVPSVQHKNRVNTPVDAFLLAKLEQQGFGFSPTADRYTLIRRAYFDLTGLPPAPEDVDAFVAETRDDAYEHLIDQLLESPQYGERWARHWLDVVGYADSEGYTNDDTVRKDAYKYRDYVVRSFNADKPFDLFIREQLAGDEMVSLPYKNLKPEDIEKLVATGFLRTAPDGTASGGVDQNIARNQVMADTLQIVGSSLLGLTVNCAQCHNHRYDPIPQAAYYRLRAIFEPGYDWKSWKTPPARRLSLYTDTDRKQSAEIEIEAKKVDQVRLKKQQEYIEATFQKELAKLEEDLREPIRLARKTPVKERTPEQKKLLKEHPSVNVTAGSLYLYDRKAANDLKKMAANAKKIRATKPVEEYIRVLTEVAGKVPETFFFERGDYRQPKQKLVPAELAILSSPGSAGIPANDKSLPTTGRRLAFATHLTDGSHPLLARVLVNRFWMHHFGTGIVNTPGDFGSLGERPTHPKLLDWLADEFMNNGWSLKRFHKLIMTSAAYRQSYRRDPKQDVADPDNRLLGGMPLKRLEAEVLRDSILAVSGELNLKAFGPPIPVMADRVGQFVIGVENLNAGRPGAAIAMNGEERRRSIWVQVRRSRPLALLDTFDLPRMAPNCESRAQSTVAPQALMLMNNDFVVRQSEQFARRVQKEVGADSRLQVIHAWKLAFARTPDDRETSEAVRFLAEQAEYFEKNGIASTANTKNKKKKKKGDQKSEKTLTPRGQALASFCQTLLSSNAFLYID